MMPKMLVATKSYSPDFELCEKLNRSILKYAAPPTEHQIIVPRSDLPQFRKLAGPRTRIDCDAEFLPSHFVPVIKSVTINVNRPWPPIRGWIQQQLVKLAAIAAANEDVVVTVDSDVEFIRPFSADTFFRGHARFYRGKRGVGDNLPRHMTWHRVARDLLGIPRASPPFPDYINSPVSWDPKLVRAMLSRVETISRRKWETVIAAHIDFSECVLYGTYVDEVAGPPADSFAANDPLCASYWGHTPLKRENVPDFLNTVKATDISVMISSKSGTASDIREWAIASLRAP